jgi:membrane-associated protein
MKQQFAYFLAHYGYWAIFAAILMESAGLPLPGETVLIGASIAASTGHEMNIFSVAVVAIVAAIIGDNLGFAVGRYGGYPVLRRFESTLHISDSSVRRAEDFFHKHGNVSVFFARFVAGLRVVAGPLAGLLKMDWKRFLFFNALGAVTWVTVVTTLGFFFGHSLEGPLRNAGWVVAAVVVAAVVVLWRKSASQT